MRQAAGVTVDGLQNCDTAQKVIHKIKDNIKTRNTAFKNAKLLQFNIAF